MYTQITENYERSCEVHVWGKFLYKIYAAKSQHDYYSYIGIYKGLNEIDYIEYRHNNLLDLFDLIWDIIQNNEHYN